MPSSPYRHFERSPRSFLHIGVLTVWLYYQARLFYHLSYTMPFLVSSFRAKSRNPPCTSAFLPDGSTGLPVFHASSHSPFSLLPGRSLDFARDDTVGRALSIIRGSQPPALRASPFQRKGGTTLTLLPLEGGAPEGRRLASRMFDYPYPRIVMRGVARNLSCTPVFLPDGSTGLPVSYAISHSPSPLLP